MYEHSEPIPTTILNALARVPRANFTVLEGSSLAGRSMPPPQVVARLIAALELPSDARVLLVGIGSGYTAAVLSRLVGEVYAVEQLPQLADLARERLAVLGIENVKVLVGDGYEGWVSEAPFSGILVAASSAHVEDALVQQLAVGGRLVLGEGSDRQRQRLIRLTRISGQDFHRDELGYVSYVGDLGNILVGLGLVDELTVEAAVARAREHGTQFLDELRTLVRIEDVDVYRAIGLQRGLRFSRADALLDRCDPRVAEKVPRAFLDHNRLLPILDDGRRVLVATTNPNANAVDLRFAFPSRRIDMRLVTPTDLRRLWSVVTLEKDRDRITEEVRAETERKAAVEDLLVRDETALEAHSIALFEALLLDAIGERASDVHLERYGERVRVRLRIDGEMHDVPRYQLSPTELIGLVNVIKVRANLDIAEKRLPQGGRIRLRAGGKVFDLRIQTQPSLHGEHVVIRLLPQDSKLLSIEELGFPEDLARHYRRLLDSPSGMVLVVGPTGSGKSTTLYAGLQVLARDARRKVITVEDPIEYSIEDVQQTQVKPGIGFAFASAMRSFVRQDPDVILVGEIRDGETALEAIRASQTGHVVLSTLHANDTVDAVQRLFDLGMHPNSIASELLAVIAQRLAKRVCEACRVEVAPDPSIAAEVFPDGLPDGFRSFAGEGCPRCNGNGTRGRVAVVEFLGVTPDIRGAIAAQPPINVLRQQAIDAGLHTMRTSALRHVQDGRIPFTELPRILLAERMAGG